MEGEKLRAHANNPILHIEIIVESSGIMPGVHPDLVTTGNAIGNVS